jgi:imidazolonepropionase-like amidohydrolase
LLAAGFNPAEAVACATFIGAALLGLSGRGKLAAGMSADFVAAIGEPRAVIAQCVRPDKIYLDGIPMQPIPKE